MVNHGLTGGHVLSPVDLGLKSEPETVQMEHVQRMKKSADALKGHASNGNPGMLGLSALKPVGKE